MQHAVCFVGATAAGEDEASAKLKRAFDALDRDGDGNLTSAEVKAAMKELEMEPTDAELMLLMQRVDKDGNGTVDRSEFSSMISWRVAAERSTHSHPAPPSASLRITHCCRAVIHDHVAITLHQFRPPSCDQAAAELGGGSCRGARIAESRRRGCAAGDAHRDHAGAEHCARSRRSRRSSAGVCAAGSGCSSGADVTCSAGSSADGGGAGAH